MSCVEKLSFSYKEARLATGAGEQTLREAIRRGDLKVCRVGPAGPGRRVLITADSLKRWLTPQPEQP